jgi:competence protein ComEC
MGDAEEGLEARLLGSGLSLQAPVLKVGHHGSRTASSPAFLEAVQPGLAVISLGAENRFGFPHEATMTALRNITGSNPSSGVHRTDLEGTIEIEYGKIPLM